MPTLSSSNRSQLAYKLEGASYPTGFGVFPTAGNGTLLNMLSETFDYAVRTESSKVIRSDRQVPDIVQVSASAQGGFAFEHTYKEYDPFIQGVLQDDYTHFNTTGISGALPAISAMTSSSITFGSSTAGTGDTSTLQKGQWFVLTPPAGATQTVKDYFKSRPFRVVVGAGTLSNTVITLDPSTPLDTAIAGSTMAVGATICTSRVSNASTMKSYSFEVGHPDIGQYRRYSGMIVSKMDLKLSVGAIVTGSFDFMGKTFARAAATGMGTPTASQTFTPANAVRGVFDIIEGGSSISATTYIRSGEFTIDNGLRGQEALGVFGNAGIAAGTMRITGKVEVYFADGTMYDKLLNGSASSLCIPVLDVDGNGYVYYFPRIKYSAAKVNAGGLDQDNMLSMDWQALPDTTAGSPTLGKSVVIYRVGTQV